MIDPAPRRAAASGLNLLDRADGGSIALNFSLERWCLWCPGCSLGERSWPGGVLVPGEDERSALDFLPIMQRRRLSPLARAAMAVAFECREGPPDMPVVFYSRHGESAHYLEMLQNLARGEDLSPSQFSLAVHNAIAGLYGLCSASAAPCVSLAGSDDDLFSAFLEAAGILSEHACERVLLVLYEQPLPEVYRKHAEGPSRMVALALRLGAPGPGPRLNLRRERSGEFSPRCQLERLGESMLRGERYAREGWPWQWELIDG